MSRPPLQISDAQATAVDRVARFVVRFHLTVPAVLALESLRPLTYAGSQFMHVLSPSVTAFLTTDDWDALALLLEDRRGLDYVLERIEALDAEQLT